jgi:hypothetical protein
MKNLKTTKMPKLFSAFCMVAIATGCHKEADIIPNGNALASHNTSQDISANYPFDWENATQMPAAAGTTPISLPWMSQSGNYIDPAILSDYHKADGWELVYDSFGPAVVPTKDQQPAGGLYFALYNRFRGLMRYYLYVPPGYFGSSTQLAHGLGVYSDNSTSSKMLNFESGDVVDVTGNGKGFTKTSTQSVNATGGWYAMQYEIAYDPAFSSTTYPHLGFTWDVSSVSVTDIALNGVEQGTLQGTITTPAPGLSGTIINGAFSVAEIYGIGGFKGKLQDAAAGALAGNLTGFLSGIFGGNSANAQEVDLKLNSTIVTKGTGTTSQSFQKNSFVFPGQQVANSNNPAPLISYPIGLFNMLEVPTVTLHTNVIEGVDFPNDPQGYGRGDRYENLYELDISQIESLVKFNRNVIGNSNPSFGANYKDFGAEVILFDPITGINSTIAAGTFEQIGQKTVYSGNHVVLANTVSRFDSQLDPTNQVVGVRVHFRIKPNNNAPESVIVKTFLAKIKVI